MNVDFPLLGLSLKPQQRLSGCCAIWVENFLESCLRVFDFSTRAIDYRFSRTAALEMALEIANFCESRSAMRAFIGFRQLCDVFY